MKTNEINARQSKALVASENNSFIAAENKAIIAVLTIISIFAILISNYS